jgi:hypothetical protein
VLDTPFSYIHERGIRMTITSHTQLIEIHREYPRIATTLSYLPIPSVRRSMPLIVNYLCYTVGDGIYEFVDVGRRNLVPYLLCCLEELIMTLGLGSELGKSIVEHRPRVFDRVQVGGIGRMGDASEVEFLSCIFRILSVMTWGVVFLNVWCTSAASKLQHRSVQRSPHNPL